MADSPTQKSLKLLRDKGYLAGVTEYWQPSFAQRSVVDAAKRWATYDTANNKEASGGLLDALNQLDRVGPGKRQDLFDFIDIIAIGDQILALQCTSSSGLSARINKIVIECNEAATKWLNAGGQLEVWGWPTGKTCIDCGRNATRKGQRGEWLCGIHGRNRELHVDRRKLTIASNGALSAEKLDTAGQMNLFGT